MAITWKELSQKQIDNMLNATIEQIFLDYDMTAMSKYEKRKKYMNI